MIVGDLDRGGMVEILAMHPVLRQCLAWIEAAGGVFPEGITQLDGERLYVNVHGYETKPRSACKWESHRHTADLQYCIAGGETIDWSLCAFEGPGEYDDVKDCELWGDDPAEWSSVQMVPGRFMFFAPGELHRPMIASGKETAVKKLVFKIQSALLGECSCSAWGMSLSQRRRGRRGLGAAGMA